MIRISTEATVTAFLLADAALTTLTGTRIWGGVSTPPRGADYKLSVGEAVCLMVVSGVDDYTDLIRHELVQFKCYASSRAKADILAGVLHGALQGKITSKIKWARRTTTSRLLTEPETDWPFAFVQYAIMVHQEE